MSLDCLVELDLHFPHSVVGSGGLAHKTRAPRQVFTFQLQVCQPLGCLSLLLGYVTSEHSFLELDLHRPQPVGFRGRLAHQAYAA